MPKKVSFLALALALLGALPLAVDAQNARPIASNDVAQVNEDNILTVSAPGVLENDFDADGDPLDAFLLTAPTNGALSLLINGSYRYTPDPDFNGTDSFTYRASDGTDDDAAMVTITVNPVNDPPVATNDTGVVDEDEVLTVAAPGVLDNDSDVDTDDVLMAEVLVQPSNGSLSLNSDGSYTYTPNRDFNGIDSFTYRVLDLSGEDDAATVRITVTPVNDAPVAVDDTGSTGEDTSLSVPVPGVLGNDTDIDGDPLSAVLVTGPSNGTVTLNPDGSYEYTPSTGFTGMDSFVYLATDGDLDSDPATVAIAVNALIPTASQLCMVVTPPKPIPGQPFMVTVTIDGTSPQVPSSLGCVATGDGFQADVCTDGSAVDVTGVVAGRIGLTFQSSDVTFEGAGLGSNGIGPAVNFPTSVSTFQSSSDDYARFSFTIPTPPAGDPTNSANSVINGKGAIVTFIFALAADARPFTMGIDPEHTSFPIASSNAGACPVPISPSGFAEGEWPYVSPQASTVVPGFPLTTVSGTVRYWDCLTPTTVPATILTLDTNPPSVDAGPLVVTNNSANATYTFNVTPDANYQLIGDEATLGQGVFRSDLAAHFTSSPTITDVTNAINATDVGAIMLHWNDPISYPLDECSFVEASCGGTIFPQQIAADVNGWKSGGDCPVDADAGRITGQDASILQQVIAARILGGRSMPLDYPLNEINDCTTNWRFFCDTAQLGVIPSEGVVYDPIGVLIGDVNGSYTNNATVARKTMENSTLVIPTVSSTEERIIIPIELHDAAGIIGVEAKVLFDHKVLRFVGARAPVSAETEEPTNHAWGVANDTGSLALIATGTKHKLEGTSTVALLEFERVDMSDSRASSPILIAHALADDMNIRTDDGFFTARSVVTKTWGEVKRLYR